MDRPEPRGRQGRIRADEHEEVELGPKDRAWVLARDRASLEAPPTPSGVRLLGPRSVPPAAGPGHGPAGPSARKCLWRPVRGPGGVLVDGEIVGTWRAQAKGDRLEISVEPFDRLAGRVRQEIETEADRVALVRGLEVREVAFSRA